MTPYLPPPLVAPGADALAARVVAVTGASDGIGKAVALAAADHGAEVILLGRSAKKRRECVGRVASSEPRDTAVSSPPRKLARAPRVIESRCQPQYAAANRTRAISILNFAPRQRPLVLTLCAAWYERGACLLVGCKRCHSENELRGREIAWQQWQLPSNVSFMTDDVTQAELARQLDARVAAEIDRQRAEDEYYQHMDAEAARAQRDAMDAARARNAAIVAERLRRVCCLLGASPEYQEDFVRGVQAGMCTGNAMRHETDLERVCASMGISIAV